MTDRRKTAAVLRHVLFEDLGLLGPVLEAAGYAVTYHDLDGEPFGTIDPIAPDLLVVLGGPVGVYEDDLYPYLADERRLLEIRLSANRPTLGICLGAQLIAAALGALVTPMGHKEIGFGLLSLTDAGRVGPLRHLEGVPVLHWHGDAFQTPSSGDNLAMTELCRTQAFAIGSNILAVQFHAEVDAACGIERWLTGHAAELAVSGIDPRDLREEARGMASAARVACEQMFREWLIGLS
ncbi:glutamine amidotransferase [Paracoccus sp. P2]|uniref:glutamine amidotransferase n=1 Tax=Alphaproteobacteria TaxID=28211 RepID=UPI000DE3AD4E|nr:glutamine amidotransferase [Sphingomonas paucimobilis]QBE91383.1 glutamine amidotransferase [Sphingomonas paucimobilis]